jgi:DNA-binding response OmpR family regulator
MKMHRPKSGFERRVDKSPKLLLAEKSPLIANDLAQELELLGVLTTGIANSVSAALSIIDTRPLDFAVLNVDLRDGKSYPVARRLVQFGIPFAFFTTFDREEISPEFHHIPRLAKPQDSGVIAELIAGLIRRPPSPAPRRASGDGFKTSCCH